MLKRLAFAALFAVTSAFAALAADDPENTLVISLKDGDVVVALRPDLAPKHVERVKELARAGAYDNVAFHRVIEGFMAQTGDVQFGDLEDGYDANLVGTGGSDKPDVPAEFSSENFVRGVVGIARGSDPDSANSQFFIMFVEYPSLDGKYTIVGNVVSGMEAVDKIKRGDEAQNGVVADPDRMLKVVVAADKK